MSRRTLLCGLLAWGFAAALAAPALAQDVISIAVLPTDLSNDDHKDIGEKLRQAMRDAVAEAPEFVESDAITMTIGEAKTALSCFDATAECLAQLGGAGIDLDRMVWAALERKEGAWILQVRMLDFASQRFIFDRTWTMPGGADRIEELVALTGGVIRGNAPEPVPTSRLLVDSDPPGADITLDGRMLGTTPVTQRVTRGRHLVELSLPGRRTVKKEIDIGAGEVRELIRLPILPKVVPPAAAPVDPQPEDWPFWVGVGAGVVAGVAIITASVAYSQGNTVADDLEALTTDYGQRLAGGGAMAEQLYDTEYLPQAQDKRDEHRGLQTLHVASVVTAAVAGGAAVYFLVFHESEKGPTVTPAVTPDGAGAFITGSF